MNGYRIWLSKLTLLIFRVNQEIDAGKTLDPEATRKAAEEGGAMEYFKNNIDLTNRRWEIQILTDDDLAFLNDHFSAYAASSADYWPVHNNGFCHYIAWATELIAQKHWSEFSNLEDT